MLTTTTTMGLRAISAAPCCTTRTILRSPYSTIYPIGLRTTSTSTSTASRSNNYSNKPLLLITTQTPTAAIIVPLPSTIRAESTISTHHPVQAGSNNNNNSTPSSSSSAAAAAAAAESASGAGLLGDQQALDWKTFFSLRKSRRRYQVAFSGMSALGASFGGAVFLSNPAGETLLTYFPLDPFIGFGLGMTAFMALGWLLGPGLGNACFYLRYSRWKPHMTAKEIQLFARIKKNRVDPTASSASNPVPDFYGEKIQSISGYRQWLKDQRAFTKKRTVFA